MDISIYEHDTGLCIRDIADSSFRGRHYVHSLPNGNILKFPGINSSTEIEITKRVSTEMTRRMNEGIDPRFLPFPRVFEDGTLPDGAPYLILENMGNPLLSYMQGVHTLRMDDIISQVQSALDILDELGIVHDDIENIGNILIREYKDSDDVTSYFISIIDFGNASYSKRKNNISIFKRMLNHYKRYFE